jgi:flagellar biosynthesis/type III secretory pathway M-ring protein FliF/YscJ
MANQNNLQMYAICITIAFVTLVLFVIFRKIGRPLSEAEAKEKIKRRQETEQAEAFERSEKLRFLKEQEDTIKNLKPPVLYISFYSDNHNENIVFTVQDGDKKTHLFKAKSEYQLRKQPYLNSLYTSALSAIYNRKFGTVLIPD